MARPRHSTTRSAASWMGFLAAVALGAPAARGALPTTADIVAEHDALRQAYARRLADLADWCSQRQLVEEAALTRGWLRDIPPRSIELPDLPRQAGWPTPPEGASPEEIQWHEQFGHARREQAAGLLKLAQQALRGKLAALTTELLLAAAREDPNLPAARRMLGQQEHQGAWLTPYEKLQMGRGRVWHARFGWLPQAHVSRYENGERLAEGRWMTAEDDAASRADVSSGWKIETEHYRVTTSHSLEEGVALAARLEDLYRVWRLLFWPYFASEAEMSRLLQGRGKFPEPKRLQVVHFRNQQEYQEALRGSVPADYVTTGIYIAQQRTAYFYSPADNAEQDFSTLWHEAAHQLFSESRPTAREIGGDANFWIVEGIACYMESMRQTPTGWSVGGAEAVRWQDARFRLLEDQFYRPLAELTGLGMQSLQRDPEIAKLYSQSAGLAHFLMHYDGGRYRDALAVYLQEVYAGRDRSDTLSKATGETLQSLDLQYRNFMSATDAEGASE